MPLAPHLPGEPVEALRLSSNLEIAKELLPLRTKRVVDVGCGTGKFTFLLAAEGAEVTGIDINDEALAMARARQRDDSIGFLNARAETMPFADGSLDVVVFSNSFHHLSPENMPAALDESARVLKSGGHLYVMEPVAAGNYFEATRLVNDERAVRAQAYEAIRNASSSGFMPLAEVFYRARRRFDSFDEYRSEQILRRKKHRVLFEERGEEIRARFEKFAVREGAGFAFDQIFRVNLLRKAP